MRCRRLEGARRARSGEVDGDVYRVAFGIDQDVAHVDDPDPGLAGDRTSDDAAQRHVRVGVDDGVDEHRGRGRRRGGGAGVTAAREEEWDHVAAPRERHAVVEMRRYCCFTGRDMQHAGW